MLKKYIIKISGEKIYSFFEITRKENINLLRVRFENNQMKAEISFFDLKRIKKLAVENDVNIDIYDKEKKFYKYFTKRKFFYFIIIFILMLTTMVFFSARASIININTGIEGLDKKILSCLEENGLKKGSFVYTLDLKKIENTVKKEISEIAWISIHKDGTEINVYTRLKTPKKEVLDDSVICNIVAECDMKIIKAKVLKGKLVAPVNSEIREGDIIVSGFYKNPHGSYSLRHANAEIEAEFKKEVVFIQKRTEITKERSDNAFSNVNLELFSLNIPIFDFDNNFNNFNVSTSTYKLNFFNKNLPACIRKTTYTENTNVQNIYSKNKIADLLKEQTEKYENDILSTYEIIDKKERITENDDMNILNITYTLRGNVGTEQEIIIK